MALTNESFRDPRKLFKLRVKSPFFITGEKEPTKVGQIVALPRSLAAEVVHSNKAIWAEEQPATPGVAPSPIMRADPPQMPTPDEALAALRATSPEAAAAVVAPKSTTDAKASRKGD